MDLKGSAASSKSQWSVVVVEWFIEWNLIGSLEYQQILFVRVIQFDLYTKSIITDILNTLFKVYLHRLI